MTEDNVDVIRALYDGFAAGDVAAVLNLMDPNIVWIEAESFPLADRNPYRGPQAVAEGVFMRLVEQWDGFGVEPEEYLDAGDTVVVLGRYRGTHKQTGRSMNPQLAHVWRVAGGKIVSFQQYVDTLAVARASGTA